MEIKKYICLFVIVFSFLSCKKEAREHEKTLQSAPINAQSYQFISYKKKELSADNKINIFEYPDTKISIEYNNSTYFGYGTKSFNVYQSSYDLDSGDLDILRYDNIDTRSQIFFVELNDYSLRTYHIYVYKSNSMYYLGELNIDLSKIIEKVNKINIEFNIKQSDENFSVQSIVNGENFSTLNYKLGNPLNVYKKYNNIDEYVFGNTQQTIEKNENNDESFLEENKKTPEKVTNHLIFTKDKSGKLVINTEILDYIQKNTTDSDNSYTIALSKYVTSLIINYYDNKSSEWTEEELFKIIGYSSNTTDPLFKKYWKNNFNKWNNGKEGYILGFCNTAYHDQIWNKLTSNFKKNNYYNLPYLEDMVWYGSDFDKTGAP